ncbi:e3 ubiquitin-protein ligase, partial [Trichonephila clavata]
MKLFCGQCLPFFALLFKCSTNKPNTQFYENMMTDLDTSIVPQVRAFDNDLVYIWSKKFESKSLTDAEFKEYWVKNVPVIYNPNAQSLGDESIIFTPLEQFICGSKDSVK